MPITKQFQELDQPLWKPSKNDQPAGNHAVVIIGFDETIEAFEIMNSSGKHWAGSGFCWIKYNDLTYSDLEGYQMDLFRENHFAQIPDSIKQNKTTLLTADLSFNKLVDYKDFIELDPIPVQYAEEDGVYCIQDAIEINDRAQFKLSDISERTYVYMFSYNENNKLIVHWPRDEQLDSKFSGLNESALVTVPEVKLVLPTPDTALQFNTFGNEYLCFLFSKTAIIDLNSKLSLLKEKNELSFVENVEKIFVNKNFDKGGLNFLSGRKAELSAYVKDNQVVPLICKIKVD